MCVEEFCEECGEELDFDCQQELRCPNCDPPCLGCSDGSGYPADDTEDCESELADDFVDD